MTPEPAQAAQPTPTAFRFGRFLLCVCVLTVLLYPLPFLFIRAPHFDQWSTSPYGRDLEYGMTAKHLDADVILFGDSAALHGLDPKRMSAELGVKVFNLPNVLSSLLVVKDMGLERYLQSNKPPKLIVFYIAPWNLDFARLPILSSYEGDEMLLRHGSRAQLFAFYRHRLPELLQFPFQFYRINSAAGLRYLRHPRPGPPAMEASMGHMSMPEITALASSCKLPAKYMTGHLAMDTAQELLARYNAASTPAIVYVAPVPGCEGVPTVLADNFGSIPAAPPLVLPPGDFAADGYYAHPIAPRVDEVTDLLVAALRPRLAAAGAVAAGAHDR